jgi:hypothetical protein
MRPYRLAALLVVAALLLGGASTPAPRAAAQVAPTGRWTPAASPAVIGPGERLSARQLLSLTDGRVLLIGVAGTSEVEFTTRFVSQRYDPATDTWSAPVPLATRYPEFASVRLLDGGALVIGGTDSYRERTFATVERYDPATDRWTAVAPMATPRGNHTATLLADGRVLVAGGDTIGYFFDAATAAAEIYDPSRNVWTPAASMITPRLAHSATRLADGRVHVAGGFGLGGTEPIATAEIYDPATDRWTAAAPMSRPGAGYGNSLPLLPNGQVLLLGSERYDPATNRWLPVAPIPMPAGAPVPPDAAVPFPRSFSVALLPDGQLLVAGGQIFRRCVPMRSSCIAPESVRLAETQRYDPATDRWVADAPMTAPRADHQAALLPDGRALVVGGDPRGATAEIYTPPLPASACFAETGQCIGGSFLAYWQRNGGLARNGFPLSGEFRQVLEDGREYTVQYFERVRLEYHPENAPPYDVLLGQFGRRVYQGRAGRDADPPTAPAPGTRYFPETGHNLGGSFGRYWEANGGLAQFGYPLTDELKETLEDGGTYTVQYFERARFEYHPENPPPYDVLLGQFGRQVLAETGGGR